MDFDIDVDVSVFIENLNFLSKHSGQIPPRKKREFQNKKSNLICKKVEIQSKQR